MLELKQIRIGNLLEKKSKNKIKGNKDRIMEVMRKYI